MRLFSALATVLLLPALVAVVLLFGADGQHTEAAPLHGAIFTTTPDGGIVNENVHYERKIEVYLDGGPGPNAPQTAAGLPDGDYVFQVTDPSGKVLLSEDPSMCRVVVVSGGVIVALRDNPPGGATHTTSDACHINDDPDGAAGESGQHDTNTDADHGPPAIVVQLMPFFDTPNPGGVYKAWIMPIERYQANGGDLSAVPEPQCVNPQNGRPANNCNGNRVQVGYERDDGFGPPRDQVKTDNFKVREFDPPMLHVRKFHDIDADGIWDPTEPEIGVDECLDAFGNIVGCGVGGGWLIDITEPTGVMNPHYTPVWIVAEPAGTWTVCEEHLADWAQSAAYRDDPGQTNNLNTQCVEVEVAGTSGESHEVIFGNYRPIDVHGRKVIDLNADGSINGDTCPSDAADVNYPGCVDVKINLVGVDGMGQAVNLMTHTCGGTQEPDCMGEPVGSYWFTDLKPGSYTISVTEPDGFVCSFPAADPNCNYDITLVSGDDVVVDKDFGDFAPAEKKGMKFHDLNANGVKNAGEPGLPGWRIHLFGTDGMGTPVSETATTDASGNYSFTVKPGNYKVCEILQTDWEQSFPSSGLNCSAFDAAHGHAHGPFGYDITLTSGEVDDGNDFGNYQPAQKKGMKFSDLNKNGQKDAGEPGLSGFLIHLFGTDGMGNPVSEYDTTDGSGNYSFTVKPGSYIVCEVLFKEGVTDNSGWVQTFPAAGADCSAFDAAHNEIHGPIGYAITLISQQVDDGNDFGNKAAEGCTPGYWKQSQHFDSWVGHSPGDPLVGLFSEVGFEPYLSHVAGLDSGGSAVMGSATLVEALQFGGGDTVADKAEILLRAAVAGVLNADHPSVDYPWTSAAIVNAVNAALASQDPVQIINLATQLDGDNNGPGGCPLN